MPKIQIVLIIIEILFDMLDVFFYHHKTSLIDSHNSQVVT